MGSYHIPNHQDMARYWYDSASQAHVEIIGLCAAEAELRPLAKVNNVLQAYSGSGQKCVAKGGTVTIYPSQGRVQPRLGQSPQQAIKEHTAYQASVQADLRAAEERRDAFGAEMERLGSAMGAARKEWQASKQLRVRLEGDYRDAQAQPPPESQVGPDGETGIEQEIASLNEQLAHDRLEETDLRNELQRAQDAEQTAQQLWHSKKEEASQMQQGNLRAVEEFERQTEQQMAAETAHAAATRKLERLMRNIEQMEAQAAAAHTEHDAYKTEILKMCSEEDGLQSIEDAKGRMDIGDAALQPKAVEARVKKLKGKIAAQQKAAGGMREDIEAENKRLESKAMLARLDAQKIRAAYSSLARGLQRRTDKLKILDKTVERSTCTNFNKLMYKKGHMGNLKVNRQDRKLQIKVAIKGDASGGVEKDLKSLSGGERSFTTVAFSLALGEWTHSPVRAMDEPDVFMDNVNRRMAMESLFQNAWDHQDLQFIFLTPLSLEAVAAAESALAGKGVSLPKTFVQGQHVQQTKGRHTGWWLSMGGVLCMMLYSWTANPGLLAHRLDAFDSGAMQRTYASYLHTWRAPHP
ncbi:hypothetical protein WJX84_000180 [Apatococcus fuscideae]|uniref:Structural maintenance of chromosomes protein 6 n=1 Tax=Apatococcus fuscideae TaxID=2026836 RepID=A0AAW1T5B2_9CHLO